MTPRAAAGLLVSALIRTVEGAGGGAMVLAKGDATAGSILIALLDRGRDGPVLERTLGPEGYLWRESMPADLSTYLADRRRTDPDLWIVEIDHPDARAIVAGLV